MPGKVIRLIRSQYSRGIIRSEWKKYRWRPPLHMSHGGHMMRDVMNRHLLLVYSEPDPSWHIVTQPYKQQDFKMLPIAPEHDHDLPGWWLVDAVCYGLWVFAQSVFIAAACYGIAHNIAQIIAKLYVWSVR